MLFKPDENNAANVSGEATPKRRRTVWIAVGLLIAGGLGYLGWTYLQETRMAASRSRPDLAVPVLAATPRIQDVPVYLDGVGTVKALNTVTVRAQVDGKLLSVNFREGQDVRAGDVLAEIDPAIYQAQYDQAVAKKAQDEAVLANARTDLVRYEQLAASKAGTTQQADTQRALVAQYEAQVKADQAAIDNAKATLGYTKVVAPLSGRAGLRQVDQGNIVHASDTTGLVVITQLQPITVWFSLPQQQIVRVNAAAARGQLAVDVFGNDGRTVVDTGVLRGIDNQVDPTTGTVKLKAEFPNSRFQLWPGQFVNVRLQVETLSQVVVVPTAAVQRGPAGTFSYVIGADNIVSAWPVTVVQQNETDAVIGKGLTVDDRVVTTGFANLADGAKVEIGRDDPAVAPDLAPRRRQGGKATGGDRASPKSGQRTRTEQGSGAPEAADNKGPEQAGQPGGSPKASQ
ncbi:efflux RND transporter periplasmic adaptor subunit [Bradyrhizobium sp. 2TAF24]|uniref:efflux RND transporter periplasmic adaptor subunit n=1 Tax=Bradyrhizobium sp. 2TAF24 TaxID=3233011 RepID=UPI003F920FA0